MRERWPTQTVGPGSVQATQLVLTGGRVGLTTEASHFGLFSHTGNGGAWSLCTYATRPANRDLKSFSRSESTSAPGVRRSVAVGTKITPGPPAQIRTSGMTAYGSYSGVWRRIAHSDEDAGLGGGQDIDG